MPRLGSEREERCRHLGQAQLQLLSGGSSGEGMHLTGNQKTSSLCSPNYSHRCRLQALQLLNCLELTKLRQVAGFGGPMAQGRTGSFTCLGEGGTRTAWSDFRAAGIPSALRRYRFRLDPPQLWRRGRRRRRCLVGASRSVAVRASQQAATDHQGS